MNQCLLFWYLNNKLQQSRCVRYNIVIKFVSELQQVGGFPRVVWFPLPIKLSATIWLTYFESGVKQYKPKPITETLLKVSLNTKTLVPNPMNKFLRVVVDGCCKAKFSNYYIFVFLSQSKLLPIVSIKCHLFTYNGLLIALIMNISETLDIKQQSVNFILQPVNC